MMKKDKHISDYVYGKFFTCVEPIRDWMIAGENYWFEYHGNDEYEILSDNELHRKFNMTPEQLMTCFREVDA